MPRPRKITGTIPVHIEGKGDYEIAFTFRTLLKLEEQHEIRFDASLQEKGMRAQMTLVLVAIQEECDPTVTEDDLLDGMGLAGIAQVGQAVSKLFEGTAVPLASNGEKPGLSPASTSG